MGVTVLTIADGTAFTVSPGRKSRCDFIVRYRRPAKGSRERQPAHTHVIVDMYMKRMGNPWLTRQLVDHILDIVIPASRAAVDFPPTFSPIDPEVIARFSPLNAFGEYSVEFLLVVETMLAAAERTNYPEGSLHSRLWQAFRDGVEIYGVLSAAGWRG